MEISKSISQLPSDDFTTACVITIIFFVVGISVLLSPAWMPK